MSYLIRTANIPAWCPLTGDGKEIGMSPQPHFLFIAVHKGPYLSIQPLEVELELERVLYLVEGAARDERIAKSLPYLDLSQIEAQWGNLKTFLTDRGIKALIRGSSEDVQERNVEKISSEAARDMGIPVFVVEDFPGNYWPNGDERLDGLFVEDDSLVDLHRSRGIDPDVIYCMGNPRYNALRNLDKEERLHSTRKALDMGGEPVMLWAGQPDGDNSYLALERLLKRFSGSQVTLLFRAHPRDGAYTSGNYSDLLSSAQMKVLDVTP